MILRKGQDVSFQCTSAYPEDTKFFFNHGKLPDNVNKIGNELYIRNANGRNKGTYECLGKLNNRPHFSLLSAVATVKFRSKNFDFKELLVFIALEYVTLVFMQAQYTVNLMFLG